jgi:hypothetical protein
MTYPTSSRSQVAFVDQSISGWQALAGAISPEISLHLIRSDRDGLEQIANVLAGYDAVDAIHLFSHGAPGMLALGNAWITSDRLASYESAWSIFRSSLLPGADLLIYGCNVAEGDLGKST